MVKSKFSLSVLLILFGSIFFVPGVSQASDETLTITTYYPSPYGVYNELTTYSNTNLAIQGGNVGIGRTVPGAKLDVNGGILAQDTSIGTDAGYKSNGMLEFTSDANLNSSTDDVIFYTNNFAKELMRITDEGNVGIGTATPLAKFHVESNVGNLSDFIVKSKDAGAGTLDGNDNAGIMFSTIGDNTSRLNMAGSYSQNAFALFAWKNTLGVGGSWSNLILQPNQGRVGIGTVSPTHLIHLSGGAYCDGTGDWVQGSDLAYKKDIDYDFQYGLKEVEQLKPVYYVHKEDKGNRKQVGFIAQDVLKVIPELVSGDEGALGLSYGPLTAVLVKAVQEQQAQINSLKAEIEQLKDR